MNKYYIRFIYNVDDHINTGKTWVFEIDEALTYLIPLKVGEGKARLGVRVDSCNLIFDMNSMASYYNIDILTEAELVLELL